MKHLLTIMAAALVCCSTWAQDGIRYTNACDLTLIGKILDTPNPYHRVDTVKYKGFTSGENFQMRCSTGLIVAFKTDSPYIKVKTQWGQFYNGISTAILSHRGYDLYIKKDGEWKWAGNGGGDQEVAGIVSNMDRSMKECLLYLPIYSEERSIQVMTDESSSIEPMANPFRHRIVFNGSSYTHGHSTSRAGLAYPMIFERNTGLCVLDFATSGNCKMQPQMLNVLKDVEADAFVFDSFSNPTPEEIEERLFPFIEAMQAAHPGVPLIFQQTIWRSGEEFDQKVLASQNAVRETAERLMNEAVKKYKDVYFIHPNARPKEYVAQVDGIHPDNYGYYCWEKSIEKPLLKILKKYGIR